MELKKTWKCEVCGYIHEGMVPPNQCAICGAGPDMFTLFSIEKKITVHKKTQWRCSVCGYVHTGEDPPDSCPVCGVEADMFERFDDDVLATPAEPDPERTRWRCVVCGHVHTGANPPDRCPVCGADASQFEMEHTDDAVTMVPDAEKRKWRCSVCGYAFTGDQPPDVCPVCGVDAKMFEPEPSHTGTATMAGLKIVVIGAGVAGTTAADSARDSAPNANITLISRESGFPYYRLNLTRFMAGELKEHNLLLKDEDWFREKHITHLIAEVRSIDRENRRLGLRDGRTLTFDKLVLANGAHPFVPPLNGTAREGVHSVRTLADARAVNKHAVNGTKCVCIGGGLLGLEMAGALRRQGCDVTVLEFFGWLLPRQLSQPAAKRLQGYLQAQGISIRCGVSVTEIQGDESVSGVLLEDGSTLPADLVILATGVRPNTFLARSCGIEVKRGIVVDDFMFTNDPNILAAGDVAEHASGLYGLWPMAYAQGAIAGMNAAGERREYAAFPPSNTLKVLDVKMFSVGEFDPGADDTARIWESETADRYVRLVGREGKLVGANLFGEIGLQSRLKEAIEKRLPISELTDIVAQFPDILLS